MEKNDFYVRVADIFGTTYTCQGFPHYKRTRWNNRQPGHGRFENFGLVRLFGSQVQVALKAPLAVTQIFDTPEEALAFLTELMG
jgi:hypothetical protein